MLGHMVNQCLAFWGTVPKWLPRIQSYWQCIRVQISPHLHQLLFFFLFFLFLSLFLSLAILLGLKEKHFIVFLIGIPLLIINVEYITICLITVSIHFWEKYLLNHLPTFQFFIFYHNFKSICSEYQSHQIYNLQIFSHFSPPWKVSWLFIFLIILL